MIRKLFLLIVLLSLNLPLLRGQNLKGNVGLEDSHRPNTSKGSGGSDIVNVDLFTGTASVGIPIYDYVLNGIDFGVSLGYTAKGIKVDELASPVGLGWHLSAGGEVTREVMGLEDEVTLPTDFSSYAGDKLQGRLVPGANINPDTSNIRSDDMEHDVFHFNLCGRMVSAAFTYRSGNLFYQTFPKSEIKIEINTWHNSSFSTGINSNIGSDSTFSIGFIVTDESGNKFYFLPGDYQYKEFGFSPGAFVPDSGVYYSTQKWNLNKVVTFTGLEVNYEYKRKYVEYAETVTEELYPALEQYIGGPTYSGISYDPLQIKEHRWKGVKTQLTKIIYPNNVNINFYSDTSRFDIKGDFKLKTITVENKYNNNVKNMVRYELYYAYFNSPNFGSTSYELQDNFYSAVAGTLTSIPAHLDADSAIKMHYERGIRLKLKRIDKRGSDTSTVEPFYFFDYNSSVQLPYRFSPQKDYYGYYNAGSVIPHVRSNLSTGGNYYDTFYLSIPFPADPSHTYTSNVIVPNTSAGNKTFGADRSYSFNNAQANSLTKVRNCAGGEIELQYQNYTLSNPNCSYGCIIYDQTGCKCDIDTALQGQEVNDGLCIGKVFNRDSFNHQNFTYTQYTLADGIRFHRGGYCWYPDPINNHPIYTNYFVGPHKYYNGSNHGFSTVTVEDKGLVYNNQLSKSVHTFSNLMYWDGSTLKSCINKPTGWYWHTHPADMRLYRLGLPLSITSYQNGYPFSTEENTFEYINPIDSIINYKIAHISLPWWPYCVIDNNQARLKTTTTTFNVYDPALQQSKSMSTVYTYDYDAEGNVTRSTWSDSKGDTFKEIRTYTHNDPDGTILGYTDVQHLLSQETWKMVGTDSVLLSLRMRSTNATVSGPLYPSNYKLRFKSEYSTRLKQPLTSTQYRATGPTKNIDKLTAYLNTSGGFGSMLVKNRQFTRYDKSGNAVEVQMEDKNNFVSSIYDAKNQKLLAEFQNARFDQVAYSSFEGDYNDTAANDYTKGNFIFDPNAVLHHNTTGISKAMTGKYVYQLEATLNDIKTNPLPEGRYVLSLWSYNTGNIFAEIFNGMTNKGMVNFQILNTVGNWNLYAATIDISSDDFIQIVEPNGTMQADTYIDEIRLHPVDAIPVSYTYTPLFGISSENNEANYITYTEYDKFGRHVITRDMRGNIILKKDIVCNGLDYETTGGSGQGGGPNQ